MRLDFYQQINLHKSLQYKS